MSDEGREYTVDVWVETSESYRVPASSKEEALEIAEERAQEEFWGADILSSRVL